MTSVRSPTSSRRRISFSRSSIWFLRGPQVDLGVDEVGRPDQLLADLRRVAQLPRAGSCRHEHHLRHLAEELVEPQRAVVERAREAEPEVDERLLARAIALVHAADLRNRLVRLVDEDHVVGREVIEQRVRRRARRPAVEDPRVVLDAVAEAELLHHLQVVLGPLPDPVRLEHHPLGLEVLHLLLELVADLDRGALDRRLRRDVLGRRKDRDGLELRENLAGERVEVGDLLDQVSEERHAIRRLGMRRLNLDHVALDPKTAAAEQRVVPRVLDVDELAQHEIAIGLLIDRQEDDAVLVLLRRTETVDARHRRDDDRVATREQARRRGVSQPVDVVVPRTVLLDVQVGLRDVRLGLVVVVVRDEVLDRVRRKELAKLVAELRGERLVVGDHERRPLDLLDDPRHRRGLARSRRAEQRLVLLACPQPIGQRRDRTRLVARRDIRRRCFEGLHGRDRVSRAARFTNPSPS